MTIFSSQDRPTFHVDMNSLRGNQVGTLFKHATNSLSAVMFPPTPGDLVDVIDEDGIRYQAVVNETTDKWLGLTILWSLKTVVPTPAYGRSGSAEFTSISEWETTAA